MPLPLYLIRTSHLKPVVEGVEELSESLEPLFEKSGLSSSLLLDPEQLILESKIWHLLGLVSEKEAMPHLGIWLTDRSELSQYGQFIAHLLAADTLYQALHLLIHQIEFHSNNNNFWLEEDEEFVWICHLAKPLSKYGVWQVEQHLVSLLCLLIEHYAGSGWEPKKIKFRDPLGEGIEQSRFFKHAEVKLRQKFSAVAIEHVFLKDRLLNEEFIIPSTAKSIPDNFLDGLRLLLKQNYFGKEWLAENIAETLNMSVRTLKRKLFAHNTSLRQVFDEVRFQQACDLIEQGVYDYEVLAANLCYTHANNFVRAFKRWSGKTPREYIRLRNLALRDKHVGSQLQTTDIE